MFGMEVGDEVHAVLMGSTGATAEEVRTGIHLLRIEKKKNPRPPLLQLVLWHLESMKKRGWVTVRERVVRYMETELRVREYVITYAGQMRSRPQEPERDDLGRPFDDHHGTA